MFKQSCNSNRKDRFIPSRYKANYELSNFLLKFDSNTEIMEECNDQNGINKKDFVNYSYQRWKKKNYQTRLQWALSFSQTKILNICERSNTEVKKPEFVQDWPVKRRLKPLIDAPVKILDMPNIEYNNFYVKVTDLSVNGFVASVSNSEIYLWNAEDTIRKTSTNGRVSQCVKWNRKGTLFAVSLKSKGIALFNCDKEEILCENKCQCFARCLITAIEWSSNNTLITACSYGTICTWDDKLNVRGGSKNYDKLIFTLALSSNERFLAALTIDGTVKFFLWPSMKPHVAIPMNTPSIRLAWHPWEDSLIALGGTCRNGSVILFSVSTKKFLYNTQMNNECTRVIDCLSFSPLTSELVVSYCVQTDNSRNTSSAIVILSNLETVEDTIHYHTHRVLDFLWGNDGTTLGTVSADETLCLWNFMGKQTNEIEKKLEKKNKERKAYSLGPTDNFGLFGVTIR